MSKTTTTINCPNCSHEVEIPNISGSRKIKRKSRRPTPYNRFVKEAMKRAEIIDVPHKQRMKAISAIWKLEQEQWRLKNPEALVPEPTQQTS